MSDRWGLTHADRLNRQGFVTVLLLPFQVLLKLGFWPWLLWWSSGCGALGKSTPYYRFVSESIMPNGLNFYKKIMLHPYRIIEWEGYRFRRGASEGRSNGWSWLGRFTRSLAIPLPTREGGAERRTERICLNINLPRDIKFSSCWIFKLQQDLL